MTSTLIKSIFISIPLLFFTLPSMAVQNCKDYIFDNNPNSRYTNHNDGTVMDNETGLMWKQCVNGFSGVNSCSTGSLFSYTWQEALQLPATVSFATYSDWRLPNFTELESLVTQNCEIPSINISLFPNAPSVPMWSSSPSSSGLNLSWSVNFDIGYTGAHTRDSFYSVRLVRSVLSGTTTSGSIVAEGLGNDHDGLISPNGGEDWVYGINETISWRNTLILGSTVDLYVIHDDWSGLLDNTSENVGLVINSKNWYKFAAGIENTGNYSVNPADLMGSGSYLILVVSVEDKSKFDISNQLFSLNSGL